MPANRALAALTLQRLQREITHEQYVNAVQALSERWHDVQYERLARDLDRDHRQREDEKAARTQGRLLR